jgi:hypothetical protein
MVIDEPCGMIFSQNQPSATIDEVQDSDEVFLFHGATILV